MTSQRRQRHASRNSETGAVETYTLDPTTLGIPKAEPEALLGGAPEENAKIIVNMLKGEKGPQARYCCAKTLARRLSQVGKQVVLMLVSNWHQNLLIQARHSRS